MLRWWRHLTSGSGGSSQALEPVFPSIVPLSVYSMPWSRPLREAERICEKTGESGRADGDFTYQPFTGWIWARRVVGKAEYPRGKENPRFVVTSVAAEKTGARTLYEQEYCARGEMETRIKEQQLELLADRTSTSVLPANQLRLYLSSMASLLLHG